MSQTPTSQVSAISTALSPRDPDSRGGYQEDQDERSETEARQHALVLSKSQVDHFERLDRTESR